MSFFTEFVGIDYQFEHRFIRSDLGDRICLDS